MLKPSAHLLRWSTLAAAALLAACGDSLSPDDELGAVELEIVSGNQQTGIAGRALADSIVVRAVRPSGTPAPNVGVTWSSTGGQVSATGTYTDADGLARVQWRAGTGSATLTANAEGSSVAIFTSTGRPNGPCPLAPSAATQRFSLGPTDYTLSLRATSPLRIAVLFADFPDAPGVESPATLMSTIVDPGIRLLEEMSYDRVNITTVAFPRWYRMSRPIGGYVWTTFQGHREYIGEVLSRANADIDFSSFDALYIFAPASAAQPISPTFNGGQTSGVVFDGRTFGNAVTFGNDSRTYGPAILAHETGHMFGLVDLYAFTPAGGTSYPGNPFKFVGAWSLMSNVFNPAHYLAWEKRKLGFLDDGQVDCLDGPGGLEAVIQPNAIPGGTKLVAVPLDASRVLAIEVRAPVGLDANLCAAGVLIYEVDASVASGTGAAQVRGSRSTTLGAAFTKCGPWADGVYGVGAGAVSTFTHASGTQVSVVGTEANGAYRVRVRR
jgi:M6 family metalloprotease-like protein